MCAGVLCLAPGEPCKSSVIKHVQQAARLVIRSSAQVAAGQAYDVGKFIYGMVYP